MASIGIALSGGGARGAAHLGVLQYLDETGIKLSRISGVSAGAVAGALYAAGRKPLEILDILKSQSYLGLKGLSLNSSGIFSMTGLKDILTRELPGSFANLKIPLTVVATDMTDNTIMEIDEGDIVLAVLASAAVPVVYKPITINGRVLADGGILKNLPASTLKNKCTYLIGSHVNKLNRSANIATMTKMGLIDRTFHMSVEASVAQEKTLCDLVIEPELFDTGMFQMKDAEKIFRAGYDEAQKHAGILSTLL